MRNLLFRHWAGIICLMCAVIFNVQYVAATNVSGTTYASNLVANDNIVLTGNTVLFMNTDLTPKLRPSTSDMSFLSGFAIPGAIPIKMLGSI